MYIHEKKNDEFKSLKKNNSKSFQIPDPSDVTYAITTNEGDIIFANYFFCKLTGYSKLEAQSSNIKKLFCKTSTQKNIEKITLNNESMISFDEQIETKQKELKKVKTIIQPLNIGDEKKQYMFFFSQKNKEQNETCSKIRQEKLNVIEEIVGMGNWELVFSTGEILWSEGMKKLLGYKDSEIENTLNFALDCVHDEDRKKASEVILKAIRANSTYKLELRLTTKTGLTKYGLSQGVVIYDNNSKPLKMLNTVIDITEKKKAQLKLELAIEKSKKTDRLKAEFLALISHEIRTPINTMVSFINLIKDDIRELLTNDLEDCFGCIDVAGQRIIRTIELLIKMSEVQTGNYLPEFKENDLLVILKELVEYYKPIAAEKKINISLIKKIDTAIINSDRDSIIEVFSNLIRNAITFTQKGAIKIIFQKSINDNIIVSVVDTGIGISEEYINQIFSPFSQESNGYTRKFDGNGIGLCLVKEYCKLNSAEVSVTSEKGLGSTFSVLFK